MPTELKALIVQQEDNTGALSIWDRIIRSAAYRSGPVVYRRLLTVMPAPRLRPKPHLDIPMFTMCGNRHLEMLEQALHSIGQSWSHLPSVTVISDGTVRGSEIEKRLAWWPAELRAESWEASHDYHESRGRQPLADYAQRHPFGRKLSAILAGSEQNRILWIDCDILFFSDFSAMIPCAPEQRPAVMTTLDWCYGYDRNLVEKALPHLMSYPPVNTGIGVYEGNLYDGCNLEPLVRLTESHCDNFTEQTILAEVVHQLGRIGGTSDHQDFR